MNSSQYTNYRKILEGDIIALDALRDLKHWEKMRADLQKQVNETGYTETIWKDGAPAGERPSAAYIALKGAQDKCDVLRRDIAKAVDKAKASKPKVQPGKLKSVKNF
jgi:hypothetical protein